MFYNSLFLTEQRVGVFWIRVIYISVLFGAFDDFLCRQTIVALITRISAAFQSRRSLQLSQECLRTTEGFPGNVTGTVTTLMLFMCHFTNWSKRHLPVFHVRRRYTSPHHAKSFNSGKHDLVICKSL